MTVGELRAALSGIPEDTRVVIVYEENTHEVEQDIETVTAGEIGGGIMQVELS